MEGKTEQDDKRGKWCLRGSLFVRSRETKSIFSQGSDPKKCVIDWVSTRHRGPVDKQNKTNY